MDFDLRRIRMRHLRCFLAVAETGSVTRAAARLNTSQPAVSRTLGELEAQIGQPLLVRTGSGVALTLTGENLRRHISVAMSHLETGLRLAGGQAAVAQVSVGMLPNTVRTLVVDAARRFKDEAPETDLRLYWATVSDLVERLRRGELDLIVGRLLSLEHMPGMSFEHLFPEALTFVARPDHPLAAAETVTLEDIDRFLTIVPLSGTIIRTELDKFMVARGLERFRQRIETVSFEFTRTFLQDGTAIACLPVGAVRRELDSGQLVTLALKGEELVSSVGMTFSAGRTLSPAAQRFAEAVREAARPYA